MKIIADDRTKLSFVTASDMVRKIECYGEHYEFIKLNVISFEHSVYNGFIIFSATPLSFAPQMMQFNLPDDLTAFLIYCVNPFNSLK